MIPFVPEILFSLTESNFIVSLRSFHPARSQAPNVAIKMQTCRQFVDFSDRIPKSIFYLSKKIFCLQMKNEERKGIRLIFVFVSANRLESS